MIYEQIFREFELKDVRYLVVGGLAVNFYGYARLTIDLDVMVDLSDDNLSRIIQVMEETGFTPRVPVEPHDILSADKRNEWIEKKGAVVFTFIDPEHPYKHVDIFLQNPLDFREAYSRREVMEVAGIKVNIASIDDIIKMKASTRRPRDLEDIHHLERLKVLRNSK